jgi:hypothetical protein
VLLTRPRWRSELAEIGTGEGPQTIFRENLMRRKDRALQRGGEGGRERWDAPHEGASELAPGVIVLCRLGRATRGHGIGRRPAHVDHVQATERGLRVVVVREAGLDAEGRVLPCFEERDQVVPDPTRRQEVHIEGRTGCAVEAGPPRTRGPGLLPFVRRL